MEHPGVVEKKTETALQIRKPLLEGPIFRGVFLTRCSLIGHDLSHGSEDVGISSSPKGKLKFLSEAQRWLMYIRLKHQSFTTNQPIPSGKLR